MNIEIIEQKKFGSIVVERIFLGTLEGVMTTNFFGNGYVNHFTRNFYFKSNSTDIKKLYAELCSEYSPINEKSNVIPFHKNKKIRKPVQEERPLVYA